MIAAIKKTVQFVSIYQKLHSKQLAKNTFGGHSRARTCDQSVTLGLKDSNFLGRLHVYRLQPTALPLSYMTIFIQHKHMFHLTHPVRSFSDCTVLNQGSVGNKIGAGTAMQQWITRQRLASPVGLEPTTLGVTFRCSTN